MGSPTPIALIVEDNSALGESMVFALSTLDWSVVGPCATVASALDAIDSHAFDAAILDYDLGEETSLEIAKRLRDAGRPFLFMSGHGKCDNLPPEFQNETCVPKPVTLDRLGAELERLRSRAAVQS